MSVEEIANHSIESVTELLFPERNGKGELAFLHKPTEARNVKTDPSVIRSADPIDQYIPVLRAQGWPNHKIHEELTRLRKEREELFKQAGI